MSCIDDPDISIRLQALDLGVAMVTSANLASLVDQLLRQLSNTPVAVSGETHDNTTPFAGVEPSADSDGEDPEEILRLTGPKLKQELVLPEDYKMNVICKIIEMCSQGTYANVVDFDWYIDVLSQLAALLPASTQHHALAGNGAAFIPYDAAASIGSEFRNIAVRVKSVRPAATRAAEWLISSLRKESTSFSIASGINGVLISAVWIIGEYAELLGSQEDMLNCSLNPSNLLLPPALLSAYMQAIPKIFSAMVQSDKRMWTTERKTMTSLLLARIVHFLEPLSAHPSLEVQERAVEFLELMRLAVEAVATQEGSDQDPPLFLVSVVPSLFAGPELNPVAPGAQRKVPLLDTMDLDAPLHHDLPGLLHTSASNTVDDSADEDETALFYKKAQNLRVEAHTQAESTISRKPEATASQTSIGQTIDDTGTAARRRPGRRGRYRDDPFYIANEDSSSGASTPFHSILQTSNGVEVDIDAIPIMTLDLGNQMGPTRWTDDGSSTKKRRRQQEIAHVVADENFDSAEPDLGQAPTKATGNTDNVAAQFKRESVKKSLLQVDSSGLRDFALNAGPENGCGPPYQSERGEEEETEMAEALKVVERLRLEMQRASERIDAGDGIPPEGTLVKKRSKKKKDMPREEVSLGDSSRINEGTEEHKAKKKKRRRRKKSTGIE